MNTKTCQGFFISEFLVYLALSACIGLFIMQYVYGTAVRLRQVTSQTDRIASLYAALDAIAHDIEQAPSSCARWRALLHDELAWQEGQTRIGWKVENGLLKRSIQNYQNQEQVWKRPVTHIALDQVALLACTPHYRNKELYALTVELEAQVQPQKVYRVKRSVAVQQCVKL
jgi:type II secretory pathway component PulJ